MDQISAGMNNDDFRRCLDAANQRQSCLIHAALPGRARRNLTRRETEMKDMLLGSKLSNCTWWRLYEAFRFIHLGNVELHWGVEKTHFASRKILVQSEALLLQVCKFSEF